MTRDILTLLRPRALLVLCVLLVISGCGFRLRTQQMGASPLQHLAVQSGDANFEYVLKRAFKNAGAQVSGGAPYKVKITSYQMRDQVASSTGAFTEYVILAGLGWELESDSGLLLYGPYRIERQAFYQAGGNDVNTGEAAGAQARQQLAQEIAMNIVRQVAGISSGELAGLRAQAEAAARKAEAERQKETERRRQMQQHSQVLSSGHISRVQSS